MLNVAFVSEGGRISFSRFTVETNGHYRLDGYSHPRFVAINPRIAGMVIHDLWTLASALGGAPNKMLARFQRRTKKQPAMFRYFHSMGGGLVELPASLVMTNYGRFLSEISDRYLTYKEGKMGSVELTSVEHARTQLANVGFTESESDAVLKMAADTAVAAKAEKFMQDEVLRALNPPVESMIVIGCAAAFGLIFGLDLAVSSPLGTLWASNAARTWLFLAAFGLLGIAIWRSRR